MGVRPDIEGLRSEMGSFGNGGSKVILGKTDGPGQNDKTVGNGTAGTEIPVPNPRIQKTWVDKDKKTRQKDNLIG